MTLLTAPDDCELVAGEEPAGPLLRLRRAGESQMRSHSLSGGKCTVGSSPQCQVCLPSPEVRPLQCLITLEANAAFITRWAAGIQLNGRDFSKSALNDGDRLTVGGWEIEFDHGRGSSRFDAARDVAEELSSLDESSMNWAVEQEAYEAPKATPRMVSCTVESSAPVPQPTAPTDADADRTSDRPSASAQAFQDSLVQHLWTANSQARRRAKTLINGIRAARFQADAMAADLSAMETELDLARAAYDSHIVNDDRLQQELDERRRAHDERLAPLMAEIGSLKADLATATAALAAQVANYETLAAELAAAQEPSAAPVANDAALDRATELEAALVTQSQQLESITLQLQAAQEEQLRLAQRYEAESRRATTLEIALGELQAAVAAAADSKLEPVAQPEPAPAANIWQNVQPIEVETPVEAEPATSWAAFGPVADEPSTEPPVEEANEIEAEPEPESLPWTLPTAAKEAPSAAVEERQLIVEEQVPLLSPVEPQPEPVVAEKREAPAWAAAPADKPASEFTSSSFIDKYRHLLEDEDASLSPLPGKAGRPVIDDEFLSPAKAETCASPGDESDEALEAYMASMMRRVKSSSSSFANEPPARGVLESAPSVISRFTQPSSDPAEAGQQPMVDFVSDQPLSFEELKLATRKVPLASDLAALREIANSTARTAIATHSHRQTRESAITKIIVAITATVSAGYLMASAPAIDTWQFWAGAATCAVGIVAAVQVLVLERRDRRGR